MVEQNSSTRYDKHGNIIGSLARSDVNAQPGVATIGSPGRLASDGDNTADGPFITTKTVEGIRMSDRENSTTKTVTINGKAFVLERWYLNGPDHPPFWGCGILPLRERKEDLIADIALAQGPEWKS